MSHRLQFAILSACLSAAVGGVACAAARAPVPAFTAHYRLLQNGSAIGTATLTLAPGANGTWTLTTESKGSAGLAALLGANVRETSTFRWMGNLPQCETYDYQMDTSIKQRSRDLRCDWQRRTITVDDKGTHTFAAAPGTLERHTIALALAAGMASGETSFTLPVAVQDRVEEQRYRDQGQQDVTVPAGTFDAVRVARADGSQGIEAWFASPKVPMPVKIEQRGKSAFTLELEDWSTH